MKSNDAVDSDAVDSDAVDSDAVDSVAKAFLNQQRVEIVEEMEVA